MKRLMGAGVAMLVAGAAAAPVLAQPVTFTPHRTSQATFRTDAPLETVVGTTAGAGVVAGALTTDVARPAATRGVIRIDLGTLKTGIESRDAVMRDRDFLDTGNETNRWAVFEIREVDIAGALVPGREMPASVRALLATSFTNHGMQIPQRFFLRLSNEIRLEVDLTLVRP